MEEKLRSIFKKKFWVGTACFSVIPIAAILMLTVFLLSYFDVMPIFHMRIIHEKLALVFSVSLLVCGSIVGVKRFLLPYARNHRLLKKQEYCVIEGVVLRYDFRDDGGRPSDKGGDPHHSGQGDGRDHGIGSGQSLDTECVLLDRLSAKHGDCCDR